MTDKTGWLIVKRAERGEGVQIHPYELADHWKADGEPSLPNREWVAAHGRGLTARYREIVRAAARQPYPGFARLVEGTGRYDKAHIYVGGTHWSREVPATADGVKQVVRRVRAQEAAGIAEAEERVAECQRLLAEAAAALVTAQRAAWAKGNVVRLAEVQEVAAKGK